MDHVAPVIAQLRGVYKSFEKKDVLSNIDFSLHRGEVIALLGPSGCGKSTLLRILAGLEKPSRGSLQTKETTNIGYVFQEPLLLPWLTAEENVLWTFRNSPSPEKQFDLIAHLQFLSEKLGVNAHLKKFPHELSGGLKMRVSILRALISKPSLLLLDEPFSSLDELLRIEAQKLFFDLWKELRFTAVVVTHSTPEALLLAQRILIMSHHGAISGQFQNRHETFVFPLSRTHTQLSHEIYEFFQRNRPSDSKTTAEKNEAER